MQVKDIMTRGAECVTPEDTLQEAARKMKNLDAGPLPVCEQGRLAGMITDRDIVVRVLAEGRDPRTVKVREAMSEGIDYCFEDEDVEEAGRRMRDDQARRLVVLDRDKRLTGVVTLDDVAVVAAGAQPVGKKTPEAGPQPVATGRTK